MSTMRQKFCDIHGLMFHDDCDDHPEFESFTLGYQAATEAAKATGTAGEIPPLPDPLEINWPELNSNALGCGVEDRNIRDRYDAAEYGWQDGVDKAIWCVPEAIYDADQMREYGQACAEAARQPAPAVQRHVYEWLHLVETKIGTPTAASAARVLKEFYEGAEPDAALAATAAPVLSDDLQIKLKACIETCRALEILSRQEADILLAATRSQP